MIVVGRNCEDKVRGCLDSIRTQAGDHDVSVVVTDDASDDATGRMVEAYLCEHALKWGWFRNYERVGAMANQWRSWNSDRENHEPGDLFVWLDLDDKFFDDQVFNTLERRYAETGALVTYGSYSPDPPSATCPPARAYPREVAEKRAFRQWIREGRGIWHNHCRAMRWEILAQITEEDCKNDQGEWWETGPDMAVYLPALELAGPRAVFLSDVLYSYSSDLDSAEWREVPDLVRKNHREMLARPPKVTVQALGRTRVPPQRMTRVTATQARNARRVRRP